MPIYKAPVEDVNFLFNDVFQIDRYDNLPGFSDASADVREAILGEAAKLSEEARCSIAQFVRKRLRGDVDVYTYALDPIADAARAGRGLEQHAAELAPSEQQVVRPLQDSRTPSNVADRLSQGQPRGEVNQRRCWGQQGGA